MEEKLNESLQEIIMEEILTEQLYEPKKKRQIALKIISTLLYAAITAVAITFEVSFVWETISILTMTEIGLEGLAFVIIIPVLIIIPIAALILYLIPFIMSLVGFGVSFKKTKNGAKRCGKIYFSVLAAIIVLTEVAIIITTVATVLAIKYH